jgi:hypothetical protein
MEYLLRINFKCSGAPSTVFFKRHKGSIPLRPLQFIVCDRLRHAVALPETCPVAEPGLKIPITLPLTLVNNPPAFASFGILAIGRNALRRK